MATITLFANKINDLPELVRNARSSVDIFKEDLSSLITSALKVDGDVCSLEDTISSLRSSTDTQEDKIDALENIADDIEDFIDEVVSVDEDAADAITQSKDDFYDEYPYLKPDCEKSGWEQFLDDLKDIGEWCKKEKCWETIKQGNYSISEDLAGELLETGKSSTNPVPLSSVESLSEGEERLLLTSDGVHEILSLDEMEDIIAKESDNLLEAVKLLVKNAQENGSNDDCTAVIIEISAKA